MKTSLAHVQSSIQATDTFECGTLTSTVAGRSPQQLGGGSLCSEDQEQLVIDEVQKHYKNRQSPYYLAELGKFFRTQKIEVPVGVRLIVFRDRPCAGSRRWADHRGVTGRAELSTGYLTGYFMDT